MSAATAEATVITEAGVYPDIDAEDYHADVYAGGSLSHSGAKTLLKTPALFAWEREHGRPTTDAFDFGHAAHRLVLSEGMDIVRVDADSWRTNAAKEQRDAARAAGKVPLLPDAFDTVTAMADQIRRHPIASKLFEPGTGTPEVSGYALDEQTGVTIRCRWDWLPTEPTGRRLIIPDYKTCVSADPVEFGKAAANYGYDLQDAWYTAIAQALALAADVAFLFVCQEKSAPYLVNVIQLDHVATRIGAHKMRSAIGLYQHCTRTGEWPGYPPEIALTSLPAWEERKYEGALAS